MKQCFFSDTVETHKSLHHKSLRNLKSLRFFGDFWWFPKKITYTYRWFLKTYFKSLRFFGHFFVTIYGSRLYLDFWSKFRFLNQLSWQTIFNSDASCFRNEFSSILIESIPSQSDQADLPRDHRPIKFEMDLDGNLDVLKVHVENREKNRVDEIHQIFTKEQLETCVLELKEAQTELCLT